MPHLFAEVSFTTEGIVAITGLLAVLAGAIAYIFKLLIKAKDDQIALALEKSQAKSWKEMLDESMAIMESRMVAKGVVTPKALAAVVPEHNSPVTPEQKATAELQTARAKITAMKLALGLPAREAGGASPDTPAAIVTEQLRQDIAEVPQKTVDKIKEQSPPPGG